MTTAGSYFDRKPASSVRPALSHLQPDSPSPQTPRRGFSSAFSSPSLSWRGEEESLVFEFGARHLCAGFAGESAPRGTIAFGPEESRRVGDYRQWLPGFEQHHHRKRKGYEWGEDHEFWRMDLREVNLGLVEDKVERAVRMAYGKYLLLDASRSRRLALILPSIIPHQLLSSILTTLFLHFQYPTISLFSTPLVGLVSAGCRSGLVIDIGWSETTVTGICEYREIQHSRTTRAMKLVTREMARLLYELEGISSNKHVKGADVLTNASFERFEDVTTRLAWCRSQSKPAADPQPPQDLPLKLGNLTIAEDEQSTAEEDPLITIPSPIPPHRNFQIRFSHLAEPVETSLFASPNAPHDTDDHDQPLPVLVHATLLHLPPDARSLCMSRLIITGGGSRIPGLKPRLLDEVSRLIRTHGWDPVRGKAADERRRRLREISSNRQRFMPSPQLQGQQQQQSPETAAATAPQVPDPIEEKIQRDRTKDSKPTFSGVVRGVETLGAWAGGSLCAGLKIKSVVEIERDSFLHHGLAGAKRDVEPSNVAQRQGMTPGVGRTGVGEKAGWTLGGWV